MKPPGLQCRRRHSLGNAFTVAIVVLFASVSIAACGASAGSTTRSTPAEAAVTQPSGQQSVSTPSTTSTASATGGFTASKTWTWTSKSSAGYTASYRLEIGTPQRLADAPVLPTFSGSSEISGICGGFNQQTDAVLPLELVQTNTTASFSYKVGSNFTPEPNYDFRDLNVVSGYSSGPQCVDMATQAAANGETTWGVSCQLQPSASCTNYSYFILENYFSPKYPDGNPQALGQINLELGPSGDEELTTPVGPGASGGQGIPLSGEWPTNIPAV